MAGILDQIPAPLRSLWDLETELRLAAQNAVFLQKDEATKHLDEARRHLGEALNVLKPEAEGHVPTPTPPPGITPVT